MTDGSVEARWRWWGQTRDMGCALAGFAILGVETYRGTYHPVGMAMAAVCLGIVGAGVLTRWLIGRYNGNESGSGR